MFGRRNKAPTAGPADGLIEGQTNSKQLRSASTLPGTPPAVFQEWNPGSVYGNIYTRFSSKPPGVATRVLSDGSEEQNNDNAGSFDSYSARNLYASADFPIFGPQYGFSTPTPKISRAKIQVSSFHEDLIQAANADIDRAYQKLVGGPKPCCSGKASTNPKQTLSPRKIGTNPFRREEINAPEKQFVRSAESLTSCIICTEDFSDTIRRPGWISLGCLHEPAVCTDCLAKSIKIDMESKIWNQIKCPECSILLVHDDIRRLADPATFSKYETIAFRHEVQADENFVWCQNCDFGQVHEGGANRPIVRCQECGFKSCFVHRGKWHQDLSCVEYDEMLQDPDNFFRVRQARHQKEEERLKAVEDIKRRQREDELSMSKIETTTKQCPGCRWPIEKSFGCDHMTCSKSVTTRDMLRHARIILEICENQGHYSISPEETIIFCSVQGTYYHFKFRNRLCFSKCHRFL